MCVCVCVEKDRVKKLDGKKKKQTAIDIQRDKK